MDLLEIDELQLYFGDDYIINDYLILKQPTIGQIISYGERKYFSMIYTLTAIPSDMKSQLDDMGLDWNEISDFDLFMMLVSTLSVENTQIILGDIDLSKLKPYLNNQTNQIVLADKESGLVIDMIIYERLVNYLRKVHGLKKKVEHAANKYTKQILIDEDRQRIELSKSQPYESFLTPLVSSVKVRMGYTKDYIRNMGLVEFMDDVSRLQIIHNADALLQGCYAGTIDMKKINKSELNWMKPLDRL